MAEQISEETGRALLQAFGALFERFGEVVSLLGDSGPAARSVQPATAQPNSEDQRQAARIEAGLTSTMRAAKEARGRQQLPFASVYRQAATEGKETLR